MLKKGKQFLKQIRNFEQNQILLGNIAARGLRSVNINNIQEAEFKVFSQWGDDGIIQYLIQNIDITDKTFVEFGVENYTESNTRFLIQNDNWSGLIIDGSKSNMDQVRNSHLAWKYDLKIVDKFITKDNINDIISSTKFDREVGLLSVDIDGNDYWIWKEISCIDPVIVIVEYNSVFGPDNPWTVPYKSDFFRTNEHYSNLFYGTSLTSICDLAESKNYAFVGTNSNGNNAYFVRKDKLGSIKGISKEEGYTLSKFKESRDESGKLTYLEGDARLELLKGMKVHNTRTGKIEKI